MYTNMLNKNMLDGEEKYKLIALDKMFAGIVFVNNC